MTAADIFDVEIVHTRNNGAKAGAGTAATVTIKRKSVEKSERYVPHFTQAAVERAVIGREVAGAVDGIIAAAINATCEFLHDPAAPDYIDLTPRVAPHAASQYLEEEEDSGTPHAVQFPVTWEEVTGVSAESGMRIRHWLRLTPILSKAKKRAKKKIAPVVVQADAAAPVPARTPAPATAPPPASSKPSAAATPAAHSSSTGIAAATAAVATPAAASVKVQVAEPSPAAPPAAAAPAAAPAAAAAAVTAASGTTTTARVTLVHTRSATPCDSNAAALAAVCDEIERVPQTKDEISNEKDNMRALLDELLARPPGQPARTTVDFPPGRMLRHDTRVKLAFVSDSYDTVEVVGPAPSSNASPGSVVCWLRAFTMLELQRDAGAEVLVSRVPSSTTTLPNAIRKELAAICNRFTLPSPPAYIDMPSPPPAIREQLVKMGPTMKFFPIDVAGHRHKTWMRLVAMKGSPKVPEDRAAMCLPTEKAIAAATAMHAAVAIPAGTMTVPREEELTCHVRAGAKITDVVCEAVALHGSAVPYVDLPPMLDARGRMMFVELYDDLYNAAAFAKLPGGKSTSGRKVANPAAAQLPPLRVTTVVQHSLVWLRLSLQESSE
jgi:hypothetical protein